MKRVIFFILMAGVLSAQTKTDIAVTAGYNKFDDPDFLRSGRTFYGIRGGVYQDDFGFQLGYEQANGANCQGLNLKRIYVNALKIAQQENGIALYSLLTLGHESSNIQEHKPSQIFVGVGAGVKKAFNSHIGGFLEARILRKLESDDTDIITTLGLVYTFDDKRRLAYAPRSSDKSSVSRYITNKNYPRYVQPKPDEVLYMAHKLYYIQVASLASSDAELYIKKLYRYGIENVDVREVYKRGQALSIVVVGPYESIQQVKRELRDVRRVHNGAFIVRF